MDTQLLWFLGLAVIALTQALVLALKLKKNNPGKHGERIAKLEEAVENIKDDIKEIKGKLE